MKLWHKILIVSFTIALIIAGTLWWIPFHKLSKGQMAIIGNSGSGPGIYLLNPLFRVWNRLPTDNLYPYYIAWSPDGKNVAFTYSDSDTENNPNAVIGIAILNLESMTIEKEYVAPSDESLDVVTWSPDGQSLIFDVYENNVLSAFQKLDFYTGKLQSIPFPQNIQRQNIGVNHIEVAQNNDYVIGGSDGVFIAPPDLESLRQVMPYMDGFFLTPDRKEITTPCAPTTLCNYSIDTAELTRTYHGALPDHGAFLAGNWSYDEKDVVYQLGSGEGDPEYIMLLDLQNKQNYTICKFPHYYINDLSPEGNWFGTLGIIQLAWYPKK